MKSLQPRRRPVLLPSCQLPKKVLAASQAPRWLAGKTAQQKERLDRLHISCAWVKAKPRPHLLDTPLTGRCLAELTGPDSSRQAEGAGHSNRRGSTAPIQLPPDGAAGERAGGRSGMDRPLPRGALAPRPHDTGGEGSAPRAPENQPSSHPNRRASRVELPAQVTARDPRSLPCQARPEALSRMAGTLPSASRQRQARRAAWLRTVPWAGRSRSENGLTGDGVLGSIPGSGAQPGAEVQMQLGRPLARLLARLARQGRRFPPTEAGQASTDGLGPALARLWATPLNGLTAPLALLEALAWPALAPQPGPPAESSPERAGRGIARAAGQEVGERPAGTPARSENARWAVRHPHAVSLPEAGRVQAESAGPGGRQSRPGAADPHGFYPEGGTPPLESILAAPRGGPARFAPPQTAENLPTLLPPRSVYDAPTPAASASLRQLARREEEAAAEEDLNLLADKIKRILDEEARRHGIDV